MSLIAKLYFVLISTLLLHVFKSRHIFEIRLVSLAWISTFIAFCSLDYLQPCYIHFKMNLPKLQFHMLVL